MCIRDSCGTGAGQTPFQVVASCTSNFNGFCVSCNDACDGAVTVTINGGVSPFNICLLYTSDAADERSSVDLGGRRIIKKKTHKHREREEDKKRDKKRERIETSR